MIDFERFVLKNGLRVLLHHAPMSKIAAVSLLYDVGSKDESNDVTGLAHLFEHLMFTGSANVKDFDDPIQEAGGENNAFTNADFTNFYDYVPVNNLELLLFMESDRMRNLKLTKKRLDIQKKVVVEEFYETSLNPPYGMHFHHLSEMAYKKANYKWPTIGIVPEHIKQVDLDIATDFYNRFYQPNNAILAISGGIDLDKTRQMVEKWFGDIEPGPILQRNYTPEPMFKGYERRELQEKVPSNAIYMAFNMCNRANPDFYAYDLLTDVLAGGISSRFYQNLYKKSELFNYIDTYITATIDDGLLIVEGRMQDGVSIEQAEAEIWKELRKVSSEDISENELVKLKNKTESNFLFSEMNIVNRAINLCYFELLRDANLINSEIGTYQNLRANEIKAVAQTCFVEENASVLTYKVL